MSAELPVRQGPPGVDWRGALPTDAALALAAFGLLVGGKAPPWMVVLAAMAGGALLAVL